MTDAQEQPDLEAIEAETSRILEDQRIEDILKRHTGELGLPFGEVGSVMQSLGQVLVERGHDRQKVIDALTSDEFDEVSWWGGGLGSLIDELASELSLGEPEDPL